MTTKPLTAIIVGHHSRITPEDSIYGHLAVFRADKAREERRGISLESGAC